MITDPEEYFAKGCGRCPRFDSADCSARRWRAGLAALRRICLDAGLAEMAKWGHPCYMHAGRNVAIVGAFRGDFRISFFDAASLADTHGVLERQGPNAKHPDMIRFVRDEEVAEKAEIVAAYLGAAMAHAAAGLRPPKAADAIDLPDELVDALDADPELAEAFEALTPGRKRSYVIQLGTAKTASTRTARILRYRDRILAGKGPTER